MPPTEHHSLAPPRLDLTDTLVLFDWNGTLVADTDRAVRATNAVLAHRGLPRLSATAFRSSWKLPLSAFLGGLGVADADAAERHWNRALATEPAPLRPDAHPTLDTLRARGARVGVVSAAGAQAVTDDIRHTGLDGRFDVVLAGVPAKTSALLSQRPTRARAYYVGDTEYDIHCARAAGYLAVAITGGYRPADALAAVRPDAAVDRLDQLPGVIAALRAKTPAPIGGTPA
ncbi:HAD family hydrolase [Yinghuangia seranimata]|uniref:HAD family hydrolase n=1 Tax=Yinghuangia seranimata TaxID=408067 RepID=UPI00248B01C6|nr:HAD family hydrolase [Yinghuangia seranimata]MDI2130118.1 HAD family hydrolase [Yinghuangia seranimata]